MVCEFVLVSEGIKLMIYEFNWLRFLHFVNLVPMLVSFAIRSVYVKAV